MGEHKINPTALAAKMGMLPTAQRRPVSIPVNVSIWHNGKEMIVQYSQKLEFISYTVEQARDHIDKMQSALKMLEEHQELEKLNTLTVTQDPGSAVPPAENQVAEVKS